MNSKSLQTVHKEKTAPRSLYGAPVSNDPGSSHLIEFKKASAACALVKREYSGSSDNLSQPSSSKKKSRLSHHLSKTKKISEYFSVIKKPESPDKTSQHIKSEPTICVDSTKFRQSKAETKRPVKSVAACDASSSFKSSCVIDLTIEAEIDGDEEELHFKRDPFNLKSNEELSCKTVSYDLLPNEILTKILSLLPPNDLSVCIRVCRRWRDLIQSPHTMLYKKMYNRLRLGDETTRLKVLLSLDEGEDFTDLISHSKLFFSIIKRFRHFKTYDCDHIASIVRGHKLYPTIQNFIKEKLPDCLSGTEVDPWCALVFILLLSHDLEETWSLMGPSFGGARESIVECLYFLSSIVFSLHLVQPKLCWSRIHYRLAYLLHHLEKSGPVTLDGLIDKLAEGNSGQQSILRYGESMTTVRLTHEQLRIARHRLRPGDIVKIKAFAGSGKTTTLINFARFNPNCRFLMIVYNKAMQIYASKKFPKNVECRTGHSLAYQSVGKTYYAKLGNITTRNLMDLLPSRGPGSGSFFVRLKLVQEVLNNFVASVDSEINSNHLPLSTLESTQQMIAYVLEDSKDIWQRMLDPNDRQVPMTHDAYLKLWQLRSPKLNRWDAVLIDEAQDMTPPLYDVLSKQNHMSKVFVGDPYQQIYSFRGAVNAMDMIRCTHEYALTESFRFGFEIAMIANAILKTYRNETDILIGKNAKAFVGDNELNNPYTVICRCNTTIFDLALEECCFTRSLKFIYFIGGSDGIGLGRLEDLYHISCNKEDRNKSHVIKDKFIAKFDSEDGFRRLKKYAIQAEDQEMLASMEIVLRHGKLLPGYIQTIKNSLATRQDSASIVYTTAHKSKGLEWNTVVMAEDFSNKSHEEVNLLYVAATRAKKNLFPNRLLLKLLYSFAGIAPCLPVLNPCGSESVKKLNLSSEGRKEYSQKLYKNVELCLKSVPEFEVFVENIDDEVLPFVLGFRTDGIRQQFENVGRFGSINWKEIVPWFCLLMSEDKLNKWIYSMKTQNSFNILEEWDVDFNWEYMQDIFDPAFHLQ